MADPGSWILHANHETPAEAKPISQERKPQERHGWCCFAQSLEVVAPEETQNLPVVGVGTGQGVHREDETEDDGSLEPEGQQPEEP